uniref:Ankyrin repeat protein n=1 Tax=viral metagenome TaxID=1070528 RepID=A0A6C0JEG5_9ZZZZ
MADIHDYCLKNDLNGVIQEITKRISCNDKDDVGWSILHDSVIHDNYLIVGYLLSQKSIDVYVTNNNNETPLQVTEYYNSIKRIKSIKKQIVFVFLVLSYEYVKMDGNKQFPSILKGCGGVEYLNNFSGVHDFKLSSLKLMREFDFDREMIRNSGKSYFITDLIHHNSYKYPVCRVNTSVPSTYKDYCSIYRMYPPKTVHAKFSKKDRENLIEKYKKPPKPYFFHCIGGYGRENPPNLFFDDGFFDFLRRRAVAA